MRQLALHLMTGGATLLILVLLALPAKQALERREPARRRSQAHRATRSRRREHPRRVFGVYVDPWHVDDWARAVGASAAGGREVRGVLQRAHARRLRRGEPRARASAG